jgi:hypothetical protein
MSFIIGVERPGANTRNTIKVNAKAWLPGSLLISSMPIGRIKAKREDKMVVKMM